MKIMIVSEEDFAQNNLSVEYIKSDVVAVNYGDYMKVIKDRTCEFASTITIEEYPEYFL